MSAHYEVTQGWRLRAVVHRRVNFLVEPNMLTTRLYISALTLCFLILVVANHRLGILEGIVVTCAMVYLILDVRSDLQEMRSELSMLKDLEQHASKLLRLNS
jgi:Ca2+/Na+ antiporter